MPIPWSKLAEIRDYLSTEELGVALDRPMCALPLIGETPQSNERLNLRRWFKIDAHQYVRVVHGEATGFAWATSDGAFAYVLTGDCYFDDGVVSVPPPEVLPDGHSFHWPEVARIGRESGDRHFLDIDFYAVRQVRFDRFHFYYRHSAPAEDEAPICVQISPKVEPFIEAQLGGSQNGGPVTHADDSRATERPPSVS
jgi:hypothetical protein